MHTNLPNELETFINKYNDYKKKIYYHEKNHGEKRQTERKRIVFRTN